VENIFGLSQQKRITDIHHHGKANDYGGCFEVSERISHPLTLELAPERLNQLLL
jgi:hypothetical protein